MKTAAKPLKHYRRKRFFYKRLMMASPRAGAIFGLSLMLLILVCLPFFAMSGFSLLMGLYDARGSATEAVLLGGVWAAPFLFLYVYGFIALGLALNTMLRKVIRNNNCRDLLASLAAFFFPFAGAAVLFAFVREKRRLFAGFAAISVALAIFARCASIPPATAWFVTWGGLAFLFFALAGVRGRSRFRFYCLVPLAGCILMLITIQHCDTTLQKDIVAQRAELSKIVGQSIEVKDYWARDAGGLSVKDEPLAAMIERQPPRGDGAATGTANVEEARGALAEYRQKYPEFIAALTTFLKLPVRHVTHVRPKDDMLASMALPELNVFRDGARYLALSIKADPENRENLLRCNAGMERLRDWSLAGNTLISQLVAMAVEQTRLNALSVPLAAGSIDADDWRRLLGDPPDWRTALARSIGDEATMYESCYNFILFNPAGLLPGGGNAAIAFARSYIPSFLHIQFQRDYLFALNEFRKLALIRNPDNLPAAELAALMKCDEKKIKRNFFILSGMLLPALGQLAIKQGEIEDFRRLAEIAGGVMVYRKAHDGKLPATLDFLPEKPLDSLTRQPIRYESGKLQMKDDSKCYGFRLYTRDGQGKDPGGARAKNNYLVRLPEPGKGEVR